MFVMEPSTSKGFHSRPLLLSQPVRLLHPIEVCGLGLPEKSHLFLCRSEDLDKVVNLFDKNEPIHIFTSEKSKYRVTVSQDKRNAGLRFVLRAILKRKNKNESLCFSRCGLFY